jgi:hypothetical protein
MQASRGQVDECGLPIAEPPPTAAARSGLLLAG